MSEAGANATSRQPQTLRQAMHDLHGGTAGRLSVEAHTHRALERGSKGLRIWYRRGPSWIASSAPARMCLSTCWQQTHPYSAN